MARRRGWWMCIAATLVSVAGVGPSAADGQRGPAPVLSLGGSSRVVDLQVSRDGHLLLARDERGELRLWDLASSMLLAKVGAASAQYESATVSGSGRWVAAIRGNTDSVNGTDTVELIEVASGAARQIYPTPGTRLEEGAVPAPSALAFSPDERLLAFATSEPSLDPPPPHPSAPEGYVGCAVHIVTLDGSAPTSSRYVRARNEETLPMGRVQTLAYVPDGSRLVLLFDDGVARELDPSKGTYGKELSLGKDATVGSATASADGRWWALAPAGEGATSTPITIWDATSGKRSGTRVPVGRTLSALAIAGSHLFVGTQDVDGGTRLERVPLAGGGSLAGIASAPEGVNGLAVDPSERVLLTGAERPEGAVTVRDVGTGGALEDLPAGGSAPRVAFGAGDGHLLMVRDGQLYEWNLALSAAATGDPGSAAARDVLTRHPLPLGDYVQAFAPDERGRPVLLVTRGLSGPLVLSHEGAVDLELLPTYRLLPLAAGITDDARYAFAATSEDKQSFLNVWDTVTGQRTARLGPLKTGLGLIVEALDLRPDGTHSALLLGLSAGQCVEECWDLERGTVRWTTTSVMPSGPSLVSPTGRRMVTYAASYAVADLIVTGLGSASGPRRIQIEDGGADVTLEGLGFVRDEAAVRLVLANGHRLDVDLATGAITTAADGALPAARPRERAAFHTPYDEAVSPTGRLRALPASGGRIDLYEARGAELLASLVVPEDPIAPDGWAVFTPDGYYAANSGATRLLGMRRGTTVLPFEQFDAQRNRPDLVFERLGVAPPEALERLRQARQARGAQGTGSLALETAGPALSIDRGSLPRATQAASVVVPLVWKAASSEALDLRVTVNAVPIASPAVAWEPKEREGSRHGTLTLELVEGPNALVVAASDAEGRTSVPERVVVTRTSRPASRRLLFLGVGVERYADERYALEFAVDDVQALAALFRTFAGPVQVGNLLPGGVVQPEEVDRLVVEATTLTDAAATREGIATRLGALLRGAGVQDTVIIALSGHGVLDAHRQCWFAPADMDFAAPERSGLSYRDLDALLAACPARRKVLLMDACHTGAGGDLVSPGAGDSTGLPVGVTLRPGAKGLPLQPAVAAVHNLAPDLLAELFQDLSATSGTVILAAASGEQVAFETPDARHGLFTHALLEGLDSVRPDRTLDGRISVRELQEFVREQVRMLSHGRQVPTFRRAPREADFLLR